MKNSIVELWNYFDFSFKFCIKRFVENKTAADLMPLLPSLFDP
jgi:hypothetical protein